MDHTVSNIFSCSKHKLGENIKQQSFNDRLWHLYTHYFDYIIF